MTMSNRKFGIEIECTGLTMEDAARLITAAGMPCHVEGYGHSAPRNWKIVPDASVVDGFEVVSPILSGELGLATVRKVAQTILGGGAKVNKTCGFHVHVDARDLSGADLIHVVKRYALHESQIDAFMPMSRRANNNRFCLSMVDVSADLSSVARYNTYTPTRLAEEIVTNRYYKVNIHSFIRHGTVEFRQHSGTVDHKKMENWIQFCLNFVEGSRVTVTRTEETTDAPVQRSNAIEKKFAKLAELFENHRDRYRPIAVSVLARELQVEESTVTSYISQFRARYGAVIKVRRNQGYWNQDRRDLRAVVGVPAPVVTSSIAIPEEHGVFHGLSMEVANYFHERIQDLSSERSNDAPRATRGETRGARAVRIDREEREARAAQNRERDAALARTRERERLSRLRETQAQSAQAAENLRAGVDYFGNPVMMTQAGRVVRPMTPAEVSGAIPTTPGATAPTDPAAVLAAYHARYEAVVANRESAIAAPYGVSPAYAWRPVQSARLAFVDQDGVVEDTDPVSGAPRRSDDSF